MVFISRMVCSKHTRNLGKREITSNGNYFPRCFKTYVIQFSKYNTPQEQVIERNQEPTAKVKVTQRKNIEILEIAIAKFTRQKV